jgi:hypothetical protein
MRSCTGTGGCGHGCVRQARPGPADGDFSELVGVGCAAARDCWAVGDSIRPRAPRLNQALHWNGRRWSQVTVPEPGGTTSGTDQELTAITCTSAANCLAAGNYVPAGGDTVADLNLAMHWDGKAWSLLVTPDPGGFGADSINALAGVRCTSPASCLAVGLAGQVGTAVLGEVLRWDGASWSAA